MIKLMKILESINRTGNLAKMKTKNFFIKTRKINRYKNKNNKKII